MSHLPHLSTLISYLEQQGMNAATEICQQYFGDMLEDEWNERDIEDWGGALLAHWRFAQMRLPNEHLVRIYNPNQTEHGWQCAHTVIEIVLSDMPFLVDSVGIALNNNRYNTLTVIHPLLSVSRSEDGKLRGIDEAGRKESWMHFEITRISQPEQIAALQAQIISALEAISASVLDWSKMADSVVDILEHLKTRPSHLPSPTVKETIAYLEWLLAGHYVFLGMRHYRFIDGQLRLQANSGLGVLRDDGQNTVSRIWESLSDELKSIAYAPDRLLMLTKSDRRSIIHRPAYLDTILVRTHDEQGKLDGEIRIVGLYSASAYSGQPRQIPVLRQKIDWVMAHSQADLAGHRGKALLNTLDTYPRDELIEIEPQELSRIALGVVSLHERSRVRAFFRDDIYQRYVSVMVFVPRDNYSTEVRIKIERLLLEKLAGHSAEYTVLLGDSPLARIQYIIRRNPEMRFSYDAKAIENEIAHVAQRWTDGLKRELIHSLGEERGSQLFQLYHAAYTAAYCDDFAPRIAVHDIISLEHCKTQQLAISLSTANPLDAMVWRIKLYRQQVIELSDCLPLLENLGLRVLDERTYQIIPADGTPLHIMDIGVRLPAGASLEEITERQRLTECFAALFTVEAENDSFNRLCLMANLAWREVLILRAYARYLKQVGLKYGIETIADCLLKYPAYSKLLVNAFMLLQHPQEAQEAVAEIVLEEIEQAAKIMPNLDDERILNGFVQAIRATQRTNFFQTVHDKPKSYLSLKIASQQISFMPQPVPLCEIFVYSPQMEGIHLRGGKVARGGLRWSDRREDFRTEVLGLVKAQIVKNTVIVPVGSKGGFIVKNPPQEREALAAAGVACYQTFIRGLLDLTDNLRDGIVVAPVGVRRRDGDDPYLVVAADKGTATFSDIANAISQEYEFWLDDAFASGGSVGYDHKKMGITARGAWVSVERSFRELGVNTRSQAFTVVGIGDMSGDVFGNGLLRSPHTRLLAAFDHRHIFLDPNPDANQSFTERERMFSLPRSSWADYDQTLISSGGGIWPRNAKSIPLSAQVKQMLACDADDLEPNALIQAILKAPVDLLYNGGIGTYVKASSQTHAEANDRGNDAVRVDGRDLRCKVIAEGGNLGFTQLGRVEYAATGGRIHTDAIDNSAGVDCSDHEVNIKILLGRLIASGDLTLKQRNEVLASMTDEVGLLVLRDNELQTLAISLEQQQASSLLSVHTRMMQQLEQAGKLSRRIEYLPSESQLVERQAAGLGLYRPELAVLLAYAKIVLKQELLSQDLIDQSSWNSQLLVYFPSQLRDRFETAIAQHPLRREIVATILTNHVINRFGLSCVFRLQEETEQSASDIVHALLTAQHLLDAEGIARAVENLDGQVDAQVQTQLQLQIRRYCERIARWLIQHPLSQAQSEHLHTCAALALPKAPEWLASSTRFSERKAELLASSVPSELAVKVLVLQEAQALLEMALHGNDTGQLAERLQLHLALGEQLNLPWLHTAIERLPRENRWQTLARMAVRDDLSLWQTQLSTQVWQNYQTPDGLSRWQEQNAAAIARVLLMFEELRGCTPDLAMISAAIRELRQRLCP